METIQKSVDILPGKGIVLKIVMIMMVWDMVVRVKMMMMTVLQLWFVSVVLFHLWQTGQTGRIQKYIKVYWSILMCERKNRETRKGERKGKESLTTKMTTTTTELIDLDREWLTEGFDRTGVGDSPFLSVYSKKSGERSCYWLRMSHMVAMGKESEDLRLLL